METSLRVTIASQEQTDCVESIAYKAQLMTLVFDFKKMHGYSDRVL